MKSPFHLVFSLSILLPLLSTAQNNYYNSRQYQNNQYKTLSSATQQAYSVPDRPYTSSSYTSSTGSYSSSSNTSRSNSTKTPSTGNNSRGYFDIGAYDKVSRQDEAGKRLEERRKASMMALAAAEQQYTSLIADHGNAKTEADHYDLVLRGMRAGIDLNAVFSVIGKNINDYKIKFGNKPEVPYHSSAALSYNVYIKSYQKELTRMLTESKSPHDKYLFLKEISKIDPSFENFFALGENAMLLKQYDNAADAFGIAHRKNKDHFAALAGHAEALLMMGDAAAAAEVYKKALSLNTENADVIFKTAWANYILGKHDETYELVKATTALLPDDAGLYLLLAALQPEGKARDTLLTNVTTLQPSLKLAKIGDMLVNYAKWLQANNGVDISVFYLDLAIDSDPKNIDYVELRYGTNKLLKRGKPTSIDEKLMEKL